MGKGSEQAQVPAELQRQRRRWEEEESVKGGPLWPAQLGGSAAGAPVGPRLSHAPSWERKW